MNVARTWIRRGNTLIGMLITVAIIAVMAVILLKGHAFGLGVKTPPRKDGRGKTVIGASMLDAKDQVCQSDLQQVRLAIQTAQTMDSNDKFPASLQDLHLPASMLKCPVGGEPYVYDPSTGQVHCPHPGHEKF